MGKPVTLLEDICRHVLTLGADSIVVEYKDSRDGVFTRQGPAGFAIANFPSSGPDAKELRKHLYSAAKRPLRTVINGQRSIIRVRIYDSFGEDAFEVIIERAPQLDASLPPSFTPKQAQYLAFIHYYSKIHRQAPSDADLHQYFRVSAPSVHEMIKTLERNGWIERTPQVARSIRLLVRPERLPSLE